MKAVYPNIRCHLAEQRLEACVTVTNAGEFAWDSGAGDAFSYQIYEAETGNLLADGPRLPFERPVHPGGHASFSFEIPVPDEPGAYRIRACPMREGAAWAFDSGSPFILLDLTVDPARSVALRQTVTTPRRLALQRALRSIQRAFVYPVRSIGRHWSLIRSMVRRDIAGRYAGSYGGTFWTLVHPLLMMLTYWFVFGVVLQTRFGDDGRPSNFVLYFLAGMLPWLAFSEAAGRAATVVIEHSNFVKKLVFPLEILPVNLVLAGLVTQFFGILVFLLGLAISGRELMWTVAYLPALLVPQILFTAGLCWFLAALGVVFRDLGQFIGFALTVWFFTTPICYPEAALPGDLMWLFEKNPLFILVRGYRDIFLEGVAPDWPPLSALAAFSTALFVAGHAWFYKLKRSFADFI